MKKNGLVAAIAAAVAFAGFSMVDDASAARPSKKVRKCMKKRGCYKTNKRCHKQVRKQRLRGQEKRAAKKACKQAFRECRASCEAQLGGAGAPPPPPPPPPPG